MRLFKTKSFSRFARTERITDERLVEAVLRAEAGLVDADLGGGVIKQRISRPGQGLSGGYRVIVFYRVKERVVMVDGFAKSALDNIDREDLKRFRALANEFLNYSEAQVRRLIEARAWTEIDYGN